MVMQKEINFKSFGSTVSLKDPTTKLLMGVAITTNAKKDKTTLLMADVDNHSTLTCYQQIEYLALFCFVIIRTNKNN